MHIREQDKVSKEFQQTILFREQFKLRRLGLTNQMVDDYLKIQIYIFPLIELLQHNILPC